MKIANILKPTQARLKTFLLLFLGVHLLNALLILLVAGFWDGPLWLGVPIPFYKLSCGMALGLGSCVIGLNAFKLLLNMVIWYFISLLIRRSK